MIILLQLWGFIYEINIIDIDPLCLNKSAGHSFFFQNNSVNHLRQICLLETLTLVKI